MGLNTLLNPYRYGSDLEIVKDMMEEVIQIHGVEIYYLPKTKVNLADLLGEDPLEFFDHAISIEALVTNVDGNDGEGDVISQFGIDVRDKITFQIMKHRWEQEITPGILTQTGMSIISSQSANTSADSIKLNFTVDDDMLNYTLPERPMEGDLIWFPTTKKLFVIEFVEHEKNYYPLGQLLTYQMQCGLFDYSSERIDTGLPSIDEIEDEFSTDLSLSDDVIAGEDGQAILTENEEYLVIEDNYRVEDQVPGYANNELIQDESDDNMIFDELNPLLIDQREY